MTQENRDQMIRTSTGLVPGLIIVSLGILFLLNNLEIVKVWDWWQLWPVVVIAIGATRLVDSPSPNQKAGGAVMILVGGAFLASNFGWFSPRARDLWPIALIGAGLVMLFDRLGQLDGDQARWRIAEPKGQPDGIAVFGGFKRAFTTDDYRGGDYVAIFGGGDINLRQAGIQADAAVITVTAIFGGLTIKVPPHWLIVNELVGIFGGHEDKTVQPSPDAPGVKRLIVRGVAMFGGVTIKN
jgi:cell wall-active antibiotic response 4TMS protein YvqF